MGKIQNSPLIEAIFELRWGEIQKGRFQYKKDETDFFPGIFSQSVKEIGFEFSEQVNYEQGKLSLPYEVKHRFRKSENTWPCFQIGLGVFTANQLGNLSLDAPEEDEYDWDDFKPVIESGLNALDQSYPSGIKSLIHPQAVLRYQDAFILDSNESLESFVSNKIKAEIHISNVFTDQPNISDNSKNIRLEFVYETSRPEGIITITVSSAQINGKRGVVIETTVASDIADESRSLGDLIDWCEEAHDLQRHTFETLIQTSDL
jgi:uncharacterized protein (TIGR04255 family)